MVIGDTVCEWSEWEGGEARGVGVGGGESVGFLFVIFLIFFEIFVSAVVF